MLAVSKRIEQIPQWKSKLTFSSLFSSSFCCDCNRCRRPLYSKTVRGFNKISIENVSTSYSLQICRNYRKIHYITSVPIGWIHPFFAILSTTINFYKKSLNTQASSFEVEVTDEFVNQVLGSIEKDPSSAKKLCTTCIEKLCTSRNLTAAAKLLRLLREKEIFLNSNSYNLLLEKAAEEKNIEFCMQIFRDFLLSFEHISSGSYINLAKALANMEESFLLLGFIEEVYDVTLSRFTIIVNRIIFAFGEIKQIDKGLLIFNHLKMSKCEIDLVTYNTILGLLGQYNRIDEMLQEFASMKVSNINPDIISYNTILNVSKKLGRLDLCISFSKEMGDRGIEPDLRTYTVLIDSFGKSGNVEESLRIFDEMKKKKMQPSIYVYRSLINNLKDSGRLNLAMVLTKEMNTCLQDLVGPKSFKRKKDI